MHSCFGLDCAVALLQSADAAEMFVVVVIVIIVIAGGGGGGAMIHFATVISRAARIHSHVFDVISDTVACALACQLHCRGLFVKLDLCFRHQHIDFLVDDFDLIPQRFEICDEIHWDVLAELSNSSVESRSRRVNHARRRRRARANLRVRHRQHLAAIDGRRWRINSKLCIHHVNCNGFILDIDEMTRVFEQLREQEMISCVRGGQLRAARALR